MRFGMQVRGTLHDATPAVMDAFVDGLMETLVQMGVEDPAVSATLSSLLVEVDLVVVAADEVEGFQRGGQLVIEAVRRLGVELGNLGPFEAAEWAMRREEMAPA